MLQQKAITVWIFLHLGPIQLFGSPNIDKSQKSYLWAISIKVIGIIMPIDVPYLTFLEICVACCKDLKIHKN
jgi:hypothetical protein